MSMPLEASLVRSLQRPGLYLVIGLQVMIAIVGLLSVFTFSAHLPVKFHATSRSKQW